MSQTAQLVSDAHDIQRLSTALGLDRLLSMHPVVSL